MATKEQQKAFIDLIAPKMQEEAKRRGYGIVSTAIAQACIESAWGLSGLAKYHNYFGMKCGSSWTGKSVNMKTKEEYTVGTLTTIRDNFRAYDSVDEGVKGYYDFISKSRYANLKTAKTPREYAEMLKADGYATSSTYVNTLVNTVISHDLARYDGATPSAPAERANGNPYPEPDKNVRYNSKGNHVRWAQYELNRLGYKLVVDGIAGSKTIDAVLDFQRLHNLTDDGIIGAKTRAALKAAKPLK